MPTLTFSELILLLMTIGGGIKWWQDRRDARSTLSTAKTEAEKTVTTLTATIAAKDREIDLWRERAMHAETIVFGGRE